MAMLATSAIPRAQTQGEAECDDPPPVRDPAFRQQDPERQEPLSSCPKAKSQREAEDLRRHSSESRACNPEAKDDDPQPVRADVEQVHQETESAAIVPARPSTRKASTCRPSRSWTGAAQIRMDR